jgi:mevalonate pyrophosphate decarboxylase
MPAKIERCLELLKRKDFPAFGEFLEEEARDLHVIFMSAGIIHLEPGTLDIMKRTATWRKEGIPVYYTINTGQDIHLLCERKNVEAVKTALGKLGFVREIIVNVPAEGARLTEQHLF